MNKKRSIKILILLLFVSNIYATKFDSSENLINNGGFELKKHRWILKGNTEIVSDFSNINSKNPIIGFLINLQLGKF